MGTYTSSLNIPKMANTRLPKRSFLCSLPPAIRLGLAILALPKPFSFLGVFAVFSLCLCFLTGRDGARLPDSACAYAGLTRDVHVTLWSRSWPRPRRLPDEAPGLAKLASVLLCMTMVFLVPATSRRPCYGWALGSSSFTNQLNFRFAVAVAVADSRSLPATFRKLQTTKHTGILVKSQVRTWRGL